MLLSGPIGEGVLRVLFAPKRKICEYALHSRPFTCGNVGELFRANISLGYAEFSPPIKEVNLWRERLRTSIRYWLGMTKSWRGGEQ